MRRVSLVNSGTTNSIGTKTEVVNGENGSVQVSTHTLNIVFQWEDYVFGFGLLCVDLKCRVS